MPTLTIDDIKVEVPEGASVLQAARQAGVKIPTLCYLEDVQSIGACRVCLVEVRGRPHPGRLLLAAGDRGHGREDQHAAVRDGRQMVVELLLSEHDGDCQVCGRSADCELRSLAARPRHRRAALRGREDLQDDRRQHARPSSATPASASPAVAA